MVVAREKDERLEGLVVCVKAEDRLFHVPAEWLTPSSKFTLLYRSFISEAPESNEGQLPAKGSLEYSEPIRARGAEEDDWPMFLLGVKATELFAFLRVLDPQSEPSDWPFGFGSKELDGALNLAQRWGFGDIEKKCLHFSRELGLPLSRPTGKKAKITRQKARKAVKKNLASAARRKEAEQTQEREGNLDVKKKVKSPQMVVAKAFNSGDGETMRRSRAEYHFAMQEAVDLEEKKLQDFLEGKAKARGRKRGNLKAADAEGYFPIPIELMRVLGEEL